MCMQTMYPAQKSINRDEEPLTRIAKLNLKNIITIIFSFFLSLFLFVLCGILIIHSTVFNPDYMRDQLNKSHYYENVTEEVEEEFTSYGSASGFDETFFKSVIDLNDVQLNVNQSLNILYSSGDSTVDTVSFEQKLTQKLTENAKSRGIKITPDIQNGIQLLAKTCTDTYTQYISIPYAQVLSPILQKLKKPLVGIEIILFALIILLAILIFSLTRWHHRAIRAYIYALSGSILMLLVLSAVFLLSGKVNKIALASKSIYQFFISYLTGFAFLFLQVALILVVILAAVAVLYHHMLKQVE